MAELTESHHAGNGHRDAENGHRESAADLSTPEALELLFTQHAEDLRRYARRLLRTRNGEVDDVVQQAFLNLAMAARSGTEIRDSGAFLNRVVRNLCMDVLRHRELAILDGSPEEHAARGRSPGNGAANGHNGNGNGNGRNGNGNGHNGSAKLTLAAREPCEMAERVDLAAWLERAVERLRDLPPNQRTAFVLIDLRGFSYEEAAAAVEVSTTSLRQHVYRARSALRDIGLPALPPALMRPRVGGPAAPQPADPEGLASRVWQALRGHCEAIAARMTEQASVVATIIICAVSLPQLPALLEGDGGSGAGGGGAGETASQPASVQTAHGVGTGEGSPGPAPGGARLRRRLPGTGGSPEAKSGAPDPPHDAEPAGAGDRPLSPAASGVGDTGRRAAPDAAPARGHGAGQPGESSPLPQPLSPAQPLPQPVPGDEDPQHGSGSAGTSAGHSADVDYGIEESGVSFSQSAGGPVGGAGFAPGAGGLPGAWVSYDGTTVSTPGDEAARSLLEEFDRTSAATPLAEEVEWLRPFLPWFAHLVESPPWSADDQYPVPAIAPPDEFRVHTDANMDYVRAAADWLNNWALEWFDSSSLTGDEAREQVDELLYQADRLATEAVGFDAAAGASMTTAAENDGVPLSTIDIFEFSHLNASHGLPRLGDSVTPPQPPSP